MKYDSAENLLADARKHLAAWQPRLLLQEEDISLELYEATLEEARGENWAKTFTHPENRNALIKVNRLFWMGLLEDSRPDLADLEQTILHELFHVRFGDWERAWIFMRDEANKDDQRRFNYEHEKITTILASIVLGVRKAVLLESAMEERVLERLNGKEEPVVART